MDPSSPLPATPPPRSMLPLPRSRRLLKKAALPFATSSPDPETLTGTGPGAPPPKPSRAALLRAAPLASAAALEIGSGRWDRLSLHTEQRCGCE